MQVPPEITFKDVERTSDLENLINTQIAKLEKVCNYIISLRVIVEKGAQRHRSGNPYYVRLEIRVPPGHELIGKRVSYTGIGEETLQSVIRRSFEKAHRQLEKLVEENRREIKSHPTSGITAIVTKIFKEDGYGFLNTLEGEEVFFHKNSVLHNHWDNLTVGAGVRHTSEVGDKGLQATTVELVDKQGAAEKHGFLHAI